MQECDLQFPEEQLSKKPALHLDGKLMSLSRHGPVETFGAEMLFVRPWLKVPPESASVA